MALYRRPDSPYWFARFQIDGRRVHRSTRETSRRRAQAVERTLIAGTRAAAAGPARMTLDVAFGHYWAYARDLASAHTAEYMLASWIELLGRHTPAGALTNASLADAIARLRGRPSRHGRPLAPGSVNRHLMILRAALRHAHLVHDAPLPRINWRAHRLAEDPPRDIWLSPADVRRLVACAARHIRPLILFAVLTGVRAGSLTRLDWRQLDLARATARLVVKGNRRQLVRLSPAAVAVLANLGPRDHGPVFTHNGRAIRSWRTAWAGACRRAGFPGLRPHDLRHIFATWARQQGGDLHLVKEALGHSSIASTDRYAHHSAAELTALVAKVADLLDTADPPAAASDGEPAQNRTTPAAESG